MKNFTKFFSALVVFFLMGIASPVQASHEKGADIYFVCSGNGTYRLVFAFYRDCSPQSSTAPTSISWTLSGNCPGVPTSLNSINRIGPIEVAPVCPGTATTCNGGTYPGTSLYVFTSDTFHIPPGCTVTATQSFCCRNASITNLNNPRSEERRVGKEC